MPIYKGKEYQERIYKGGGSNVLPQRRIYKGKELVYGFYDINYYSYQEEYKPRQYNFGEISNYAWGKNRYIAPASGNTYFDDKTAAETGSYKTHWDGWFDDIDYTTERSKWSDGRYIVTYLEHDDLLLYAKWRQKKFTFSGVVGWYSGGDWDIRTSWPSSSSGYPWDIMYGWDTKGQCTWYCYGRSGETTDYFMPNGIRPEDDVPPGGTRYPDAKNWPKDGDCAAGNIIVCDCSVPGGHVIFIERVNSDGSVTVTDTLGHPGPWTISKDELSAGKFVKAGITLYLLGYSKNPSGGKHETMNIPEQECQDQDKPSVPDPTSYHDKAVWEVENHYTYERVFKYDVSGSGTWGDWGNKVSYWNMNW